MKADSPRWKVLGAPASPAEQAALDTFRELLPDDGITSAWCNLTFLDMNGRTAEVDVLLLTPAGMFLVELKGWHGTIRGNSQRWTLPGRNVPNPYVATDSKAKRLASLLKDGGFAKPAVVRKNLPFIKSLVVMHGQDSTLDLDWQAAQNVVTLDGYNVKASGERLRKFSEFLSDRDGDSRDRVDGPRAKAIEALCLAANFKKIPKVRMVADYQIIDSDPIAEGPDWQDVLAEDPGMRGVKQRIRLYDVYPGAPRDERHRIEQQAKREIQLTHGIRHEGITTPTLFRTTPDGPALVFDHDPSEIPLDAYLQTDDGSALTMPERIVLVRRLAETLLYAHQRHLVHRALGPQHVYVSPENAGDGAGVRPAIRDWFAGQKALDASATRMSVFAGTSNIQDTVDQDEWLYLAPEAVGATSNLPGIPLDVYGMGALALLVLTGRPPADNFVELEERFTADGGLDPRRGTDTVPDGVAEVVLRATRRVEAERTASIADFLDEFNSAWKDARNPDGQTPHDADGAVPPSVVPTDALEAEPGDFLADRFLVETRRGEGATGLALGVVDDTSDNDRQVILKIARSDSAAARLRDEAAVLAKLDHRRVVKLLEPEPLTVDGRVALLMSDAGERTLASRLATEGRSTVEQLENFGGQLFEAMEHVEQTVGFHRDIKPANLGIIPDPGSRRPSLVLFDFSLATEPVDVITAGTPGYLDPFLGEGRRRVYDRHAELWALATTLFEMSTGQLPWWPDGSGRPTGAESPVIEPASFEPSVATALAHFFRRALAPATSDRFGSTAEMAAAWYQVFNDLDLAEDDVAANDELASKVTRETPVDSAGLSARALSGVRRLPDIHTVGDLLGVSGIQINRIHGLGEQYRKEILRRLREWRETLDAPAQTTGVTDGTEQTVASLLRKVKTKDARAIVEAFLYGVPSSSAGPDAHASNKPEQAASSWPTALDVATYLGLDEDAHGLGREKATGALLSAVETWSRTRDRVLDRVRTEVVEILASAGRIMTRPELARAIVATRGSLLRGEERERAGSALLRAVIELDTWHEDGPKLELRRRRAGKHDLVALQDTANPLHTDGVLPAADLLTELAGELGDTADSLVADGRIVPFSQAAEALQTVAMEVTGPEVAAMLGQRRLLRLASAASTRALVSTGFDELYPADLSAATALGATLRGRPTARPVPVATVFHDVYMRFPGVRLPDQRAELDSLVRDILPGMIRQDDTYVPRGHRTTTKHAGSALSTGVSVQGDGGPPRDLDRRLRASFGRHAALTLCARPRDLERTGHVLESVFASDGLTRLDVSTLVLDAVRPFAEARRISWDFVLEKDAAPADSADRALLTKLVQQAVGPAWASALQNPAPLLITRPSVLVRYGLDGLLADLLDLGTSRPAARWLLVARRRSTPRPLMDGVPVPTGADGWVDLPTPVDLTSQLSSSSTSPASIGDHT
ncbi:BREX system serine/threonine kinase PglW [Brevibacterium litoralis]|uniref:BREX system serine/threonine kinase PglW n=1 Tax=Brevibacterium litoralis TaxID=3138935 RepID=UPI0032EC375D